MRKISPEEIPPLCPACQTPMIIDDKFWRCKNSIQCGGEAIAYKKKRKKHEKQNRTN